MNHVADEMKAILEGEDVIEHYGIKYRSGRYPYGSGEEPYKHGMDWLGRYEEYKKQGLSAKDIAREMGCVDRNGNPSTGLMRLEHTYAADMRKIHQMQTAKSLAEDGLSPTEIGRRMGKRESSIRELLKPGYEERAAQNIRTAERLREIVDEKGMLDVTAGTEKEIGVSKERLNHAIFILQKEGYPVYSGGIPQPTNPGQQTTQKVLCIPGTPYKDIYKYDKIASINEYTSHDGGDSFDKMVYPKSLDSKRLKVLLADDIGPDGEKGIDKDGLIQIRRGVEDLSLGDARYSQVRILVDDKKYLKGMAVYSDNMPDGIDVIFNSNKTSMEKALKDIKTEDPMNPFGTTIKPGGQSYYIDKDGNRQLSLINKKSDEGDWSDWNDSLPSQFLSKQPKSLIKKQLNLAKADKLEEFETICSYTNPTVKKYLLEKFASDCDSAAVELKAAALPGQKYNVMIPINTIKDTEVYAPRYPDGTKLALVRYPHAGTFEIPILTVNNKYASARKILPPDIEDAIGLSKKNAEQLSGADFDGDTVMCIPTHDKAGKVRIKNEEYLPGLIGFDPQREYPQREGMRYMKNPITGQDSTQKEMGMISNLISDMTLFGAPPSDMTKAVRHSMVVIDAAKHKLDFKRSEAENDIQTLKNKWQVHLNPDGTVAKTGGAATIISRAKGEESVLRRQGTPKTNVKGESWYDPSRPEGALIYKVTDDLYYPDRQNDKKTHTTTIRTTTGKKVKYDYTNPEERERYEPVKKVDPDTGEVTFTNKAGDINYRVKERKQPSTRMAETDDANTLVSSARNPKELLYADYANSMKALANKARLEAYYTEEIERSPSAAKTYANEVKSLNDKLLVIELNKGRERAALRQANTEIKEALEKNPDMSKKDLKKLKDRTVKTARSDVGSLSRKDKDVIITDKEWEAIQAGAISKTKLKTILENTDMSKVKERVSPRTKATLSASQINKVKAMQASNFTLAQIAEKMGVSPTTISKYLKGAN